MSFDALAPYYRGMELVLAGNLLQRCRTAFLAEVRQCRRALLLGEGPGRYLLELLRANPHVRVTCLDSSARMLAIAQSRIHRAGLTDGSVEFVCSDWTHWAGHGGPFDLVATHFFLDCFREHELAELISRMSALASPDASWVLSDFCVPGGGWQRLRARVILKLAYGFFRFATQLSASRLVSAAPFLRAAGFQLHSRRVCNHGLLQAELWRRTDLAQSSHSLTEMGTSGSEK